MDTEVHAQVGYKPRACVFGAGEYFRKLKCGLEQNFTLAAVFEKGDTVSPVRLMGLKPDCILILTPPAAHFPLLTLLAPLGVPIFVEKPAVINQEELLGLDRIVSGNPRIYFSDFYLDVRAAPLLLVANAFDPSLRWLSKEVVCSRDATELVRGGLRAVGEIKEVRGSILEGVGPAATMEQRAWLLSSTEGGVFLDLLCHLVALVARLFPEDPIRVDAVQAGQWREGVPRGQWEAISDVASSCETYAGVSGLIGKRLSFLFEVGKYWDRDDRNLTIIGTKDIIRMEFAKPNVLRFRDKALVLKGDYYALVSRAFRSYLDSGTLKPHNYRETCVALNTVFQCKAILHQGATSHAGER